MRLKVFDVFTKSRFGGNPTGVVYWKGAAKKASMFEIASELCLPDTIFIFSIGERNDFVFDSFAFSPYSELSICGQGIIAAVGSLVEDGVVKGDKLTINTALGKRSVFHDGEIVYASLGIATAFSPSYSELMTLLNKSGTTKNDVLDVEVIDLGRRRTVVEVRMDVLGSLRFDSNTILEFCQKTGTTGLVFFARESFDQVRSRHFTTSLNGKEDAVTGGASGAILAMLRMRDLSRRTVLIHQGDYDTKGGFIYTYLDEQHNEIFVGGKYVKVLEGKLEN